MSALAVIAALLLEQWRPLGERKSYFSALAAAAEWLERSFNSGEGRHGMIAWLVGVLPVLAASLAAYYLLLWVHPLLALAFNVVALYFTLGFRQFSHYFTDLQLAIRTGDVDRARELIGQWRGEPAQHRSREEVIRLAIEEALVASHRHVFGVLFWFVLLPGPSGAILYRLTVYLRQRWRGLGAFGEFAERACRALEWPAVRLTAASFAVVGDFEDTVYCWRTQAPAWPDPDAGVILAAGAGALGVRLGMPLTAIEGVEVRPEMGVGETADAPFLDGVVGLVWRALVVWVFLLMLLALASVL
ncbi:MAG: CobD/CbiB family protein [Betaproteobacteria bacterium]|nr:CobD/CbiB family protein [Betaproteobacteria bacterium]